MSNQTKMRYAFIISALMMLYLMVFSIIGVFFKEYVPIIIIHIYAVSWEYAFVVLLVSLILGIYYEHFEETDKRTSGIMFCLMLAMLLFVVILIVYIKSQ